MTHAFDPATNMFAPAYELQPRGTVTGSAGVKAAAGLRREYWERLGFEDRSLQDAPYIPPRAWQVPMVVVGWFLIVLAILQSSSSSPEMASIVMAAVTFFATDFFTGIVHYLSLIHI